MFKQEMNILSKLLILRMWVTKLIWPVCSELEEKLLIYTLQDSWFLFFFLLYTYTLRQYANWIFLWVLTLMSDSNEYFRRQTNTWCLERSRHTLNIFEYMFSVTTRNFVASCIITHPPHMALCLLHKLNTCKQMSFTINEKRMNRYINHEMWTTANRTQKINK